MGLPTKCKVLVIGNKLSYCNDLFKETHFEDQIPSVTTMSAVYDLILYHSSSANSRPSLQSDLKQIRQLLTPTGLILFFAENIYSLHNFKNFVHGKFGLFYNKLWYRQSGYKKSLQLAGFKAIRIFLPQPHLERPEELVFAQSKKFELPNLSQPLHHLFFTIGAYSALVEGYIFLARPDSIGSSDLLKMMNAQIISTLQLPSANMVLERLDIRLRGALVLFITEKNTGSNFIVRLVSDNTIDNIVSKNHSFLEYLRSYVGLPELIINKLPRPICRKEFAGSIIYVETMISGIIAWKKYSQKLRRPIFRDSVDFLLHLHHATQQLVMLNVTQLTSLFADDFARLANCDVISTKFRKQIENMIFTVQDQLIGKKIPLVVSHGDYGYGNIVVDPHTGMMQGVIDWDTGKSSDFPGIDLLNLFVQKERIEKGYTVSSAFSAIINGTRDNDYYAIFLQFGIPEELFNIIVYISFIRYLTRSAQYPNVFLSDQNDYELLIAILKEKLPI